MKRVLVIDDAATVRMFHRSILEEAGYEVDEAVNGMEALEKALPSPYDLYLVDVNMPTMDGYSFLRRFRAEAVPQAPAIMVSTEAAPSDEAEAYRAGANTYIVKPVNPALLLSSVRLLLGEPVL